MGFFYDIILMEGVVMSVVNYDEINQLLIKSRGYINEDVIEYAKNFLITRIRQFIPSEEKFAIIKNRILNIDISLFSSEEYQEYFFSNGGKGLLPGALYHNGKIAFKDDVEFTGNSFHKLIHEMLHAISDIGAGKAGLYQIGSKAKSFYGFGFDEACTEFLTSVILDEPFTGYSLDLNYVLQMFMLIADIDIPEILDIYLNEINWINPSLQSRFSFDKTLIFDLVKEYDQRLPQVSERLFDANKVLRILIKASNEKLNKGDIFEYDKLIMLLSDCYRYFTDIWEIKEDVSVAMGNLLDLMELKKRENQQLN